MPRKKSNENKSYEESVARLEEIASFLESGTATLDESIALFDESVALFDFCDQKLKEVKQKIEIVSSASSEERDD